MILQQFIKCQRQASASLYSRYSVSFEFKVYVAGLLS